jgi:quercetin dioxygenase-like cupin family protein
VTVTSLPPGGGDALWMFDSLDTIKASSEQTDGRFAVVEFLEFEGSGPPTHVHARTVGIYVLEGNVTFSIGGERTEAVTGSWICAPPGVELAWTCRSTPTRMLAVTAPAGFEDFYREVGLPVTDRTQLPAITEPDVGALIAIAAKHDVTIVGPPLT